MKPAFFDATTELVQKLETQASVHGFLGSMERKMLRLAITSLLAAVFSFAIVCVGIIELYLVLVPPKPGEWGGALFVLFLAFICGVVAAIVGAIATHSIGSESRRSISRWDCVGWLIGFVFGLGLSLLIPNSYELFFRALLGGIIIPLLMLTLPPLVKLLPGASSVPA